MKHGGISIRARPDHSARVSLNRFSSTCSACIADGARGEGRNPMIGPF